MMLNMAGQLACFFPIHSTASMSRSLLHRHLYSISSCLTRNTALSNSTRPCWLSSSRNVTRTKLRQLMVDTNILSTSKITSNLPVFSRLYLTSKNFSANTYYRSKYLGILRTLSGAYPGLGTARHGPVQWCRWISSRKVNPWKQRNRSVMMYGAALVILFVGFTYAAVPLYAVFCQATGLGGQVTQGHNIDLVEDMVPVRHRQISIRFNADTAASMQWNFRPQQLEIKVVPGETALAFYSACNPMDKPITGISTYNVVPFEAGQYFNKIQCFCFEEQRLNPHEQVDMPVFFYIDPEFAEDPKMAKVDSITLSYTFFEAKEGLVLPDPFTRPAEVVALQ